MSTTTSKEIREHIAAVIEALTPSVHELVPFVSYIDAAGADFRRWARSHPADCTRVFQVRTIATSQGDASNTDVQARLATFDIVVAYSQRWRAGQSLDRDDTMEADQIQIEGAVGRDGYANFAGANPHASWLGPSAPGSQTLTTFEREATGTTGVDFLVIRQTMRFYRAAGA